MVFHELVAHKGLREVLAPDAFHSMLDSVSSRHGGEARFREIAERYHLDLGTENGRREAAEEYIAHLAEERNEALKPSWWREFLAQVKQLLRRLPYLDRVRWSDREIEALLRRSARAMRRRNRAGRNAASGSENDILFAAALRRKGAPNTAEKSGQLRDSNVPHAAGFMEANGLTGKGLYADYEFLLGRHPEYFSTPEEVRAVVEFVLDAPELAGHILDNLSFVRQDVSTGKIYRIEISPRVTGKRNQIRSAHEITEEQYKKIGDRLSRGDETASPDSVRHGDEAKASEHPNMKGAGLQKGKKVSDFLRYNINDSQEKSSLSDDSSHFSIIGEEGAAAAAEWYGRQDAEMWKMLGFDLSTQQGNAIKRLEDLSVAKRMAEAGKEAETIKLATGWEKGADGKWRTETDDNWQFSPEFLRLEPYESLPIDRCIQEGTELFSAYPDLREFNVRLSTSLEMQQSKGWFDRDEHEFVLQQDGLPAMKKTLIHEIQHYIQEQEGFAPGGNLYTASRLAATGNYSSTELADAYRKFHDNVKLLPGDLYENIGRVLHEDSFRNFRDVLGEELGELWGSKETAIDFMRNAYDSSNRETFLQIYEAELEKAEKGHPDAFSLYRRLAGEVEARNAERRSGLSLEERLRTLLANTEDVSEQDKIYLEKNTADLPLSREEDSAAFQRWFADSKVVDADGKPLVVYHGSPNDFTVFSYKFNNSNGQAEGRGFYFTDNRSYAEGYQSDGGKLFEVYLSLQNPLNPKELTITKPELRKIINAIDPDGDGISNYAEDSRGYPGSAWRNRALDSAVNAIYDSSENDADIIGELYSSFGGGTVLEEVRRISGYDGFMTRNENGDTVYVVFSPTQIKSATENVGTFDPENPDIRFSESGQAEELANLMAKRVAPIIRDANGRDSDVREEVRTLLSQEGFDTPIASGGDNSLLTFRFVALYSLQNRIHDNDGKPDRQKNQSVPEGEEPYHQGVLRTLRHQHRFGQPARTRHRQPEFECASPHQPDAGNLALLPLPRGDRQRFSDPPPRGARTHSQPRRKGCRLFQPHPRPAEVRRRTPPHGAAPRVRNQRRFLPALRGGDRLSGPR